MNAETWKQLKPLFHAALELEPAERAAFLRAACNDDELRNQVEQLLASHDEPGAFLVSPALVNAGGIATDEGAGATDGVNGVGQRIGPYEILSKLGAGGMGDVYLAQDDRLGRKVALKLLLSRFTSDADRLRRFQKEARAASALNHPNILTIHEIGQIDGHPFIATEFIDGQTLREHTAKALIKLEEALEVAVQVASALAAAHQGGIIHRDIKPENIMIRHDGFVKVLDFGLVKLTESRAIESGASTLVNTDAGVVMGTANYMSPEQARGLMVDTRTDIWSLGVVLYELVTGRVPFEGATPSDVLSLILQKEPAPLARYSPEVPTELERIIRKALHKDREERYQTVKDFLIDLKNLRRDVQFKAELDRSSSPNESDEALTVMSSGQAVAGTAKQPAAQTNLVNAARPTSSAEYIVAEIKGHKQGVAIALGAIVLLSVAGAAYYFGFGGKTAIDSIAVLPFANPSKDQNVEYLSDGISEALINSLTELRQLRVVARSTAFRYKGKEVDPKAVGRELNVQAVLMGRVRQLGDTLNIQVDLVDATTGAQIWGKEYERKVLDVLAVKQAIAREITEKLRVRLSDEDQKQLVRRDTTNGEAYQFYLKGRYYWNKRTAENIKKAVEQFQNAANKDPSYALAYAGLADCYLVSEEYSGKPARDTIPKAKAFAERALELDDSLVEARTSLAFVNLKLWQWEEADRQFKRTIELNPNYPTAHFWYSIYLRDMGRFDEALTEGKRAEELDTLSLIIGSILVEGYWLAGDFNSSIAQGKKLIDLDPTFPRTHDNLGCAYLSRGRNAEAIQEFQKALDLSSGLDRRPLRDLGYAYGISGKRAQALAILKQVQEKYERQEANAQDVAAVYAGLGQKDEAFAWLEKAFEGHSGSLLRIRWEPPFDPLRSDPRYADLMRRMGLQP